MDLDARTHRRGGIVFVSLVLENPDPRPLRFRVANRLDGPLFPPRVQGVTAAGWDAAGYEGVVAGGGARALGYASDAAPADPPAELVWVEPAGESEPEPSPAAILRDRGDPRPPADVVVPAHRRPTERGDP